MAITSKSQMNSSELDAANESQPLDWRAEAAAISHPAAYWLLRTMSEKGSIMRTDLETEFGNDSRRWLAMGQLLRAHYIDEGTEMLHLTALGSEALERFERLHPELAKL